MTQHSPANKIEFGELIGFIHKYDNELWKELNRAFPDFSLVPGKTLGSGSDVIMSEQVRVGLSVALQALQLMLDQVDKSLPGLRKQIARNAIFKLGGMISLVVISILLIFWSSEPLVLPLATLFISLLLILIHLRTNFSLTGQLSLQECYYQMRGKQQQAERLQQKLIASSNFLSEKNLVDAIKEVEQANHLSAEIRTLLNQRPGAQKLELTVSSIPNLPLKEPSLELIKIPEEVIQKVRTAIGDDETMDAIQILIDFYEGKDTAKLHLLYVIKSEFNRFIRDQKHGLEPSTSLPNRINKTLLEMLNV